jgi:hypothetical protein
LGKTGQYSPNRSTISLAPAPQGSNSIVTYATNVGTHEAGHSSRALPQYDGDAFELGSAINPVGAESGTVMEQGAFASELALEIREFSEDDAADLREALNSGVEN